MNNINKKIFTPIPSDVEKTAKIVLDAAFKVHNALGPGLLESVYETCLAHEIRMSGVEVEAQAVLPVKCCIKTFVSFVNSLCSLC